MKKKIITTAILLTGLISASTYHYTFKISDTSLFNNSQQASNSPTMQDATPQERTGVPSTGVILASDGGVDWYGEVSANDLISGDDLAVLIGLTAGISQHSDSGWLHVGLDGTELFIAKRPLRNSISWDSINSVNAVYGNRIINIQEQEYKIRLMKGANSNPSISGSGWDVATTHGSEWNRIFYRLTDNTYLDSRNTKNSEGEFTNLANYSEADLVFHNTIGNGSMVWCQETGGGVDKLYRGHFGVSYRHGFNHTSTSRYAGWLPVLEKVN